MMLVFNYYFKVSTDTGLRWDLIHEKTKADAVQDLVTTVLMCGPTKDERRNLEGGLA